MDAKIISDVSDVMYGCICGKKKIKYELIYIFLCVIKMYACKNLKIKLYTKPSSAGLKLSDSSMWTSRLLAL